MSSPSRLRLGVIGTGAFAQACHIPGLQSHPKAKVVALCGRRGDVARGVANKFDISDVYTDFRDLCARPDIDAVTIATPNVAHTEQVHEALRQGKHVFCEKPLGITVKEVLKMTEAAEANGKIHQVAFTFRYNYGIHELRRRIGAGDIGQPFYARVQYDNWEGLKPDWKVGWREKQQLAGGGLLFDVGSHLFDIARHVLGPIDKVIGFTHQIPRLAIDQQIGKETEVETDDLANVWIQHVSGVRGQFFVSRITPPFAQSGYFEIIGPEGALKAALSRGGIDFLKLSRPNAPEWTDLPLPPEASDKQPHALGRMMRSFVDGCLRGHLDPERDASFQDGLAAQEAIDAVLTSAKEQKWIKPGKGDARG
jgi:predicted dehydrogenase